MQQHRLRIVAEKHEGANPPSRLSPRGVRVRVQATYGMARNADPPSEIEVHMSDETPPPKKTPVDAENRIVAMLLSETAKLFEGLKRLRAAKDGNTPWPEEHDMAVARLLAAIVVRIEVDHHPELQGEPKVVVAPPKDHRDTDVMFQ